MARGRTGDGTFFEDRDRGLWVGEIDLGYVNGKRKRRRVTSKSRAVAWKKFKTAQREAEQGVHGSAVTVEKWLRYWLTEIVEPNLKPKTARTYRSYVETHLIPILGRKRLDQLEPQHIRALHREMRGGESRRGDRISETTIHHAQRILGKALKDAMTEQILSRNVASLVPAPTKAPASTGALTLIQARNALAACDDPRMLTRWVAAFLLAGRQGECLGLRWSHLNLDTGVADLAWSLQRIHYRHGCVKPCGRRAASCPERELAVPHGFDYLQLHKTQCLVRPKTVGSTRVVPLPPLLHEALRRWAEIGASEPNPHDLVWRYPDGRPIDGRRDYQAWCDLLEKAKVPHLALHEARHTAATLLGEAGVSDRVRMEILGHSVVATANRYRHVNVTESRAALTAVEAELLG